MTDGYLRTDEYVVAHAPDATPTDVARWAANTTNFQSTWQQRQAIIEVLLTGFLDMVAAHQPRGGVDSDPPDPEEPWA